MATKTKPKQTEIAQLKSQLERYESFFGEIDSFIGFVRTNQADLKTVMSREAELKSELDEVREHRKQLQDAVAGAKDSLYRLVEPGPSEFMPLFDRMEEADDEKHGEHSTEWRTTPIAALKLSPVATQILHEADVVAVGQLQDRVLDNPGEWWEEFEGMSAAVAAAVVDKLNDFIYRETQR